MKSIKYYFVFFLFPFFISAQTDTIKTLLDEIIVSANKTETPYYSLASSVTVITQSEIVWLQPNSVIDLLKNIPGISIPQQGGIGKLANVFTRGANPNHTLVLLDGVEMNDASSPNNAFDFSSLSVYDIDRIEIVRGPQSTLYGSDAMAGVISIFTKKNSIKPNYSINGEAGSNGFYKTSFSTSGIFNSVDYFISLYRLGTDGISASNSIYGNKEKDGFINNGLTASVNYNFNPTTNLRLLYKLTKSNSELDQNEKLGDDPNFNYKTDEQILAASFSYSTENRKWENILNASLIKRINHAIDGIDDMHPPLASDSYNNSRRVKYEWQNNFRFIPNNLITVGIETETETANTSYSSESQWGPYISVFPSQSITTSGFYIQNQITFLNSFFTSVGLRYDKNNKYGSVVTYRIAPAYYFSSSSTKIRMTYGTGFKAPSLFYIFDPMFGNPKLKPETSKGWDFGFDQSLLNNKLNISFTYFNLRFEEMFGFDSNFRTINIARASSKGIEFSFETNPLEKLSICGSYTFTEAKDLYEQSADFGQLLIRRPKHQSSLIINYDWNGNYNLNINLRYVGKRDDKDFTSWTPVRVSLPDYFVTNIAGSIKIYPFAELTARVENLFDKSYEEVLYYGTLGRAIYFGLNVNL